MIASCLIARRSSQRIIFEQKRLKSALEFFPSTSHLLTSVSSRNVYLNQINVRDNLPYDVSSPDRRGLDAFRISESTRNHMHSLRSVKNSILLGSEKILPVPKSKFIAKSNEHKSFEDYLHRFSTSSSNLFIRNFMTGQNIRHDFSLSCCTVHRAHFSTSSKNPQNATDKDVSTQEALSKVSDSMKTSTKGTTEKMWEQVQASIKSASMAIANFVVKLPGWTFYYATHPSELRQALYRLWEVIKHEAHHYWMGTKLLYADMQTARKLFGRTLQGSTLTRRERKQLLRTVSDLFRLVPFSMFIIIPFMEFALPFALRIFPNMLPSTFQDSLKAEENMKRELQSRIAMAQFFQE
jgi:LETM1-like protein